MITNSKTKVQSPAKNNDNFYRRQLEIDSFLVKQYRKPSHLLIQHNNSLDYGTLNEYKLDDLINVQSDGFNQPKIVRLAFVDNNSIHLEEEAIQMFQKYVKNQISFIAIYGKTQSGKSLLLDKLINLCEFTGTYFTTRQSKQKGLYLWSVPFSKGNLKVFLIDIDGYTSEIDNSYFMLLDFMMLMCSVVLFLAEPQDHAFDELATVYKHINKSRSRFKSDGQINDSFWPNNIYCLFRRAVSITKGLQSIIKMFNQFNFTVIQDAMDDKQSQKFNKGQLVTVQLKKYGHNKKIISQEYIKRISGVIRDIMLRIEPKSYMNLRYTGANLIKLTINAVQYLNLKGYLKIDKIFNKSMKELYSEAYNFHTQMYNDTLIEYLNQEEPMEIDYLLKAFQNSSDEVLRNFNGLRVNQQLKEQYLEKLEKYISQKQKMVLEINKKKSKNKAKVAVPELPQKLQIKQLTEFVKVSKEAPKNYEQVYVEELGPRIAAGYKYIDNNYKDDDKELRQKSIEYQRKIEAKSKELEDIRRKKSIKSSETTKTLTLKSNLEVKEKKLNQALKNLYSQCQESKLALPQNKNKLKASKSVEVLKAEELALKREKKQRQRILEQLKSQSPVTNKELISHLQSKISEQINKQRDLQNMMTSQMRGVPTAQILKSTTSLSTQRKVQSRVFDRAHSNIRIIPSPKA